MQALRLIRHDAGEPAWNMQVDAALLEECAARTCAFPPTLRIYGWREPAVTLGRFQHERCLDPEGMARAGAGWARRPTGGRAVWHRHSVTFSLVAAARLLGESPVVTARLVHTALAAALRALGLPAELGEARRWRHVGVHARRHPLCLAAPWQGECVVVAGFRVAGIAQARRGAAVLVQGSLPLLLAPEEAVAVFAFPDGAARSAAALALAEAARGVAELAGRPLPASDVEEALAAALGDALGLTTELRSPGGGRPTGTAR